MQINTNKFSSDWIAQYTPTDRIRRMNLVIEVIETAADVDSVLNNDCFAIDGDGFMRTVESTVYGRRFTRYILLKLDYYFHNHFHPMPLETLSVEHILPQNPTDDSQWKKDFDNEYRATWTAYSTDTCRPFHVKPATQTAAKLPPVPRDVCHPAERSDALFSEC